MDTTDIRKGLKMMLDGQPYVVIDFQFVKPGKGQAFTRVKARNMLNQTVLEQTFKSGEKLEEADVEERELQYIYPDGSDFVFMDAATGEQISIDGETIKDESRWLTDSTSVDITFFKGRAIGISAPNSVTLQVESIEKSGDSKSLNQATLSTGAVIGVPVLINEGDWIKIEPREWVYMERVNRR